MSGVTVERVSSIRLDPRNPGDSLVTVSLDEDVPIRSAVRADIADGRNRRTLPYPFVAGHPDPPEGRRDRSDRIRRRLPSREPAREAMDVTGKLDQADRSLDASGQKMVAETLAETADRTVRWERAVSIFAEGISSQKLN